MENKKRLKTEFVDFYYRIKCDNENTRFLKLACGFDLENCLLSKVPNNKDTIVDVNVDNSELPENLEKMFLGYEDKYYLLSKEAISDIERLAGFKFDAQELTLNECVAIIKNIVKHKYLYVAIKDENQKFIYIDAVGRTRKTCMRK